MIVTIIGWLFVIAAAIIFLMAFIPFTVKDLKLVIWHRWFAIWLGLLAIGGVLLK